MTSPHEAHPRAGGDRTGRPDAHTHDHAHSHAHHHDLRELGRRRLTIVLVITAVFMIVELVGGLIANSLALIADSAHMLSDVGALALSAFALWFARRPATPSKSFGYQRIEILAAFVNGATLLALSGVIVWQAWHRLQTPEPVNGTLMLGVAFAGLLVNIIAALLLHAAAGHSLNIRGAYLHVLGDLLGSVGAIIAALVILATGWLPADAIISMFVASLILVGSWRLVRESIDVLLEATPAHIRLADVQRSIERVPAVEDVYDLHVWTVTSGFLAMSGHVVISDLAAYRDVLDAVHTRMHDDFGITHVTVQVEPRTLYTIRRDPPLPG